MGRVAEDEAIGHLTKGGTRSLEFRLHISIHTTHLYLFKTLAYSIRRLLEPVHTQPSGYTSMTNTIPRWMIAVINSKTQPHIRRQCYFGGSRHNC